MSNQHKSLLRIAIKVARTFCYIEIEDLGDYGREVMTFLEGEGMVIKENDYYVLTDKAEDYDKTYS